MSPLLDRGLEGLGLPAGGRERGLLAAYAEQIALWNRRANLVRAGGDELIVRHLLDSLAAWRIVEARAAGGPVADVGSGAGLPGIPLSIVLPALSFVLVERAALRASFLRTAVALLALRNVEVVESDLAAVRGRLFPLVVFRAFRPLSRALAEVAPIVAAGGTVAAYAGRRDSLLAELALSPSGYRLVEIVALRVPFLEAERHAVVLERGGDVSPWCENGPSGTSGGRTAR